MKGDHIAYRSGYKYVLHEDYSLKIAITGLAIVTQFINLTADGVLTIFKGYAWDGASGPTVDTKSSMRASLCHDVLYQLMRMGLLPRLHRAYADRLLREIGIEDGMWPIRAQLWERAVRLCAADSSKPKGEPPVHIAP
jgi:hypothetical protein